MWRNLELTGTDKWFCKITNTNEHYNKGKIKIKSEIKKKVAPPSVTGCSNSGDDIHFSERMGWKDSRFRGEKKWMRYANVNETCCSATISPRWTEIDIQANLDNDWETVAEIAPPFTRRITTRNFKFSLFISVDEIREYRNRILDRPILLDFIYIYIVTYSKVMVIEAQKSTETSSLFFFFFFPSSFSMQHYALYSRYSPFLTSQLQLYGEFSCTIRLKNYLKFPSKKKIHKNELHGGKKIFWNRKFHQNLNF